MSTRYTIEDVAPLLALRERDGLSLAELSRRSGIKTDTLRRWERRLATEDTPTFIEVEFDPSEEPRERVDSSLRITIGVATIEVGASIDRDALRTAVDALLERC